MILLIAILVVLLFGFVILFGPPYLPTRRKQLETALELLDLKKGQTLLELGSGDGRVVVAAAKRGLRVVGIELNPILVIVSRLRAVRYGGQVRIIWGDYFRVDWPPADGIYTFMIQRQMSKLDKRIEQWHTKPVKLASLAFQIPGKKPAAKRMGIFLYNYR